MLKGQEMLTDAMSRRKGLCLLLAFLLAINENEYKHHMSLKHHKHTLDGLPGVPLGCSLELDGPWLGRFVVALGCLLVVLKSGSAASDE